MDWGNWAQAIKELAELGIFDQKAVDLVAKRFTEPYLRQSEGMDILELYKYPDYQALIRKRIRAMMVPPEKPLQRTAEFDNLFATLARNDPLSNEVIEEGATNASPSIRWSAAKFIDRLPRDKARKLLKALLIDPDETVRDSALFSVNDLCTPKDKAWLTEIAKKEPNKRLRKDLEAKIFDLDMP